MFFVIETQLAKHRLEEMIQNAERERLIAQSATAKMNLVANAINAIRSAFARSPRSLSSGAHKTVTAR